MGASSACKAPPATRTSAVGRRSGPSARMYCGGITPLVAVPPLERLRPPPSGAPVSLCRLMTLSEAAAQRTASPPHTLRAVGATTASYHKYDGKWTPAAVTHARIVARLRERGHSLAEIRTGGGERPARLRLHRGPVPRAERGGYTLDEAAPRHRARDRAHRAASTRRPGFNLHSLRATSARRTSQFLRYVAAVLARRLPPGRDSSSSSVSTARRSPRWRMPRFRLFHLYVHEPLMRDGVPGRQMGQNMEALGPRAAAPGLADDGSHPPALPASLLRRAGRDRAHGDRPRGRQELRSRPPPRRHRLRGPRGLHAAHGGGGRGAGARRGRALRRVGRAPRSRTTRG